MLSFVKFLGTKQGTREEISISKELIYKDAFIAKPRGEQSEHWLGGFTAREYLGSSFMKSAGVMSGLCDSNNDTKPATKGDA